MGMAGREAGGREAEGKASGRKEQAQIIMTLLFVAGIVLLVVLMTVSLISNVDNQTRKRAVAYGLFSCACTAGGISLGFIPKGHIYTVNQDLWYLMSFGELVLIVLGIGVGFGVGRKSWTGKLGGTIALLFLLTVVGAFLWYGDGH